MGAKIRVTNETRANLLIQVELTGTEHSIAPGAKVVVDTDFDKGEEIVVEVKSDRVVVWGGVAAKVEDGGTN
jgi:hypothetical protein